MEEIRNHIIQLITTWNNMSKRNDREAREVYEDIKFNLRCIEALDKINTKEEIEERERKKIIQKLNKLQDENKDVVVKIKDAPIGARFYFIDDPKKYVYVITATHLNDVLVVRWSGNTGSINPDRIWISEMEKGYDVHTKIQLINC